MPLSAATSSTPRGSATTAGFAGFYVGNDGNRARFSVHRCRRRQRRHAPVPSRRRPGHPARPRRARRHFRVLPTPGRQRLGLVAGYYGDSTTSPNTASSTTRRPVHYSFLDDPAEAFNNGIEVTQITGINDLGELSGFYTDANGIAHSFAACRSAPSARPLTPPFPSPARSPCWPPRSPSSPPASTAAAPERRVGLALSHPTHLIPRLGQSPPPPLRPRPITEASALQTAAVPPVRTAMTQYVAPAAAPIAAKRTPLIRKSCSQRPP